MRLSILIIFWAVAVVQAKILTLPRGLMQTKLRKEYTVTIREGLKVSVRFEEINDKPNNVQGVQVSCELLENDHPEDGVSLDGFMEAFGPMAAEEHRYPAHFFEAAFEYFQNPGVFRVKCFGAHLVTEKKLVRTIHGSVSEVAGRFQAEGIPVQLTATFLPLNGEEKMENFSLKPSLNFLKPHSYVLYINNREIRTMKEEERDQYFMRFASMNRERTEYLLTKPPGSQPEVLSDVLQGWLKAVGGHRLMDKKLAQISTEFKFYEAESMYVKIKDEDVLKGDIDVAIFDANALGR